MSMNSSSREPVLIINTETFRERIVSSGVLHELGYWRFHCDSSYINLKRLYVDDESFNSIIQTVFQPLTRYNVIRTLLKCYRRAKSENLEQKLDDLQELFRVHIRDCFKNESFWASEEHDHSEILFGILRNIGQIPERRLKQLLAQVRSGFVGARHFLSNLLVGLSDVSTAKYNFLYLECREREEVQILDEYARKFKDIRKADYMESGGTGRHLILLNGYLLGVNEQNRLFSHDHTTGEVMEFEGEPHEVRGWTTHNGELFVWSSKSICLVQFHNRRERFSLKELYSQNRGTILRATVNLKTECSYNYIIQTEDGTFGVTPFNAFLMPNTGTLLGGYEEHYVIIRRVYQESDKQPKRSLKPAAFFKLRRGDDQSRGNGEGVLWPGTMGEPGVDGILSTNSFHPESSEKSTDREEGSYLSGLMQEPTESMFSEEYVSECSEDSPGPSSKGLSLPSDLTDSLSSDVGGDQRVPNERRERSETGSYRKPFHYTGSVDETNGRKARAASSYAEYEIVHFYGYAVLAKVKICLKADQQFSSFLVGKHLFIIPEVDLPICYDMEDMSVRTKSCIPDWENLFVVHNLL